MCSLSVIAKSSWPACKVHHDPSGSLSLVKCCASSQDRIGWNRKSRVPGPASRAATPGGAIPSTQYRGTRWYSVPVLHHGNYAHGAGHRVSRRCRGLFHPPPDTIWGFKVFLKTRPSLLTPSCAAALRLQASSQARERRRQHANISVRVRLSATVLRLVTVGSLAGYGIIT